MGCRAPQTLQPKRGLRRPAAGRRRRGRRSPWNALKPPPATENLPNAVHLRQGRQDDRLGRRPSPSAAHVRARRWACRQPRRQAAGTTGNDGSIVLWDLAAQPPVGRPLRPYPGIAVNRVAFSPDGRTLAAGLDNGIAVLIRAFDGRVLHRLTTSSEPVFPVAFSPDGNTLVTGSFDGTVALWDPATGAARRAWTAHAGALLSATFSPDGRVLATSATDRAAVLWDARSGKQTGGRSAAPCPSSSPMPGPSRPSTRPGERLHSPWTTPCCCGTPTLPPGAGGLGRRQPRPDPAGMEGLPPRPALPAALWHPLTPEARSREKAVARRTWSRWWRRCCT
jgi:WD40 repeat protein